jgi:hypothetical protein
LPVPPTVQVITGGQVSVTTEVEGDMSATGA